MQIREPTISPLSVCNHHSASARAPISMFTRREEVFVAMLNVCLSRCRKALPPRQIEEMKPSLPSRLSKSLRPKLTEERRRETSSLSAILLSSVTVTRRLIGSKKRPRKASEQAGPSVFSGECRNPSHSMTLMTVWMCSAHCVWLRAMIRKSST